MKSGFTLIEVIIVIAIMVTAAAAAVLVFTGTLEMHRLRSAADTIRAEWTEARIRAMEDGQIQCFRCRLGSGEILVDPVLDAHFTAGFSSRETSNRFDTLAELDPLEKGNFTGDSEDFILRDPSQASVENGSRLIRLPETIFAADLTVIPDERAAFYLGLTTAGESEIEDNMSESEEVTRQELRLGESSASDGSTWSAPIFFYPDGTTSNAAILLKTDQGRCIEIRLRGMTGVAKSTGISSVDSYVGELDATRERDFSIE